MKIQKWNQIIDDFHDTKITNMADFHNSIIAKIVDFHKNKNPSKLTKQIAQSISKETQFGIDYIHRPI